MYYVSVIYDRWECLRIAFEEHDRVEIILPGEPIANNPPFSTIEFITQAGGSDLWNLSLWERIIEWQHSASCTVRREVIAIDRQDEIRFTSTAHRYSHFLRKILSGLDKLLGKVFFRYKIVLVESFFSPAALVRINLAIGQVPRLFRGEFERDPSLVESYVADADSLDRSGLRVDFQAESDFERFVRHSIASDLPYCLVEGFPSLRDRANRLAIRTGAIATANSHWWNDDFKAWIAEATNRGVRLAILEHGGSLPAFKHVFDFEEDICDVKGVWFLPCHPKHIQVPPSKLVFPVGKRLPGFRAPKRRKHCSILGVENTRYSLRASFCPIGAQCLTSLDLVVQLLGDLTEEVKLHAKVKPYPIEFGWNTWQRYVDSVGQDHVLKEGRLDRVFDASRVIVCTYPETTFSEAMASGVPTILLYADALNERNPVAYPLLETLRSASVVFHDPGAAARHINAIWDDPDLWWESPDVLRAREEFRLQATLLDSDWVRRWTSFVEEVVS